MLQPLHPSHIHCYRIGSLRFLAFFILCVKLEMLLTLTVIPSVIFRENNKQSLWMREYFKTTWAIRSTYQIYLLTGMAGLYQHPKINNKTNINSLIKFIIIPLPEVYPVSTFYLIGITHRTSHSYCWHLWDVGLMLSKRHSLCHLLHCKYYVNTPYKSNSLWVGPLLTPYILGCGILSFTLSLYISYSMLTYNE